MQSVCEVHCNFGSGVRAIHEAPHFQKDWGKGERALLLKTTLEGWEEGSQCHYCQTDLKEEISLSYTDGKRTCSSEGTNIQIAIAT